MTADLKGSGNMEMMMAGAFEYMCFITVDGTLVVCAYAFHSIFHFLPLLSLEGDTRLAATSWNCSFLSSAFASTRERFLV
jgi:hypothetical protein